MASTGELMPEIRIDEPHDPKRIYMDDVRDVARWCALLHCTPDELREAVSQVGSMSVCVAVLIFSKRH
jgi:hypothetical protein